MSILNSTGYIAIPPLDTSSASGRHRRNRSKTTIAARLAASASQEEPGRRDQVIFSFYSGLYLHDRAVYEPFVLCGRKPALLILTSLQALLVIDLAHYYLLLQPRGGSSAC